MSREDTKRFAELLTSDKQLFNRVRDHVSRKLTAISELGSSHGYEFSAQEFGQFLNYTFLSERTDTACQLLQNCLEIETVDQDEPSEFKTVVLDNDADLLHQLRAKSQNSNREQQSDQDVMTEPQVAEKTASAWDTADQTDWEPPPEKPWWRFW